MGVTGVAAIVGIAIWQSKPSGGFWQLPGWLAVIAFGLGVILMLIGLLKHDAADLRRQTQTGGSGSGNYYQAGRDITINEQGNGGRNGG